MIVEKNHKTLFDEIVELGKKKIKEYEERGLIRNEYDFDDVEIVVGPELPNRIDNAIHLIDQCLKKTPPSEIPEELIVARALLEEASDMLWKAIEEELEWLQEEWEEEFDDEGEWEEEEWENEEDEEEDWNEEDEGEDEE